MKKEVIITIERSLFSPERTIGKVFKRGDHVGYSMEDTVRDSGVKVAGKTAIPAGTYSLAVTFSPRFKKDMILVEGVPNFTGVRIHGGNTEEDSLGCPLVGRNTDWTRIWNCKSLNYDLLDFVREECKKGIKPLLEIREIRK
jgi:hypothetical protein